jgi:hypothetical protein
MAMINLHYNCHRIFVAMFELAVPNEADSAHQMSLDAYANAILT